MPEPERVFTCGRVRARDGREAFYKMLEQVRAKGYTPGDRLRLYETAVNGWYEYYIEIQDPSGGA